MPFACVLLPAAAAPAPSSIVLSVGVPVLAVLAMRDVAC